MSGLSVIRQLANHLIVADEAMRLVEALRVRSTLRTDAGHHTLVVSASSEEAKALYEALQSWAPNAFVQPVTAPQPTLPERCEGMPANRCALQDEEARLERQTIGGSLPAMCKGCRYTFTEAAA